MNLDSPQFDFVYSNVIERNLDNGAPTTAVPLKFNHLFSAFGFTFENDSPSSFNIKSATLKVHDQAAATIDYSNVWDKGFAPADADNWNPEVTYTGLEPEIPLSVISGKTEVSLQPNTCYDMFHGDEITDMAKYDKYTLIWPQDLTGKTLVINYDMTVTRPYTKYVYDKNSRGSYKVEFTEVGAGKGSYKEEIGYSFFLTYTYYTYVGEGKGSFDVASVTKVENGSYNLVEWSENVTENKTLTIDLTKKEASKDEQRCKLLFDTINQMKQELNTTSKVVQDKLHAMGSIPQKKVVTHRFEPTSKYVLLFIGGLALSLVISIWGNLTQWREHKNWEEADLKYRALKMVLPSDDSNIRYIEKHFSVCRDEKVIDDVRSRVAVYEDSIFRYHKMVEIAAYKDSLARKLTNESNEIKRLIKK